MKLWVFTRNGIPPSAYNLEGLQKGQLVNKFKEEKGPSLYWNLNWNFWLFNNEEKRNGMVWNLEFWKKILKEWKGNKG